MEKCVKFGATDASLMKALGLAILQKVAEDESFDKLSNANIEMETYVSSEKELAKTRILI